MRMHSILRSLFATGLGLVLTAGLTSAQPAAKPALPEGLNHVPLDAMGFLHIRAGDFLKSALGKSLLQELHQDREASKGLKEIEKTLGITAADLESVTILMLTPPKNNINPQMRWDVGPPPTIRGVPFDMPAPFPVPPPKVDRKIEEKKEAKEVLFQEMVRERFLPPDDPIYYQPVMPRSPMSGPLVIVTSTKPLDQKKILRSQLFATQAHRYGPASSVVFLSERSVLMGEASELGRYSEAMGRKAGPKSKPMESALALGVERHLVIAGGHLSAEMRQQILSPFNHDAQAIAPLTPLMQTDAGLALNFSKTVDLTIQFSAPNEANAAHALQAVKTLRVMAELALEKIQEAGESGGAKRDLEKAVAKTLADAVIEQKGTTIRAQLKLEISPAVFKSMTKEIVASIRVKGDRGQSINNLKQIGLALHAYHDTYKRFPPAGISSINDPNGKPLLSWRVAILPFIDQQPLYQQFDLTQSWDSPQNKKLIAKMPSVYLLPGSDAKEGETHYRVLVGPSTIFEPGVRVSMVSITDGTSNTIMAVEAKEPTIWTRPDDLPFDPKGALPKLGTTRDGFNALFGDGTVRFIRSNTPEETIRALITRNGGEAVQLPDDR